jgi:hypothetical protein
MGMLALKAESQYAFRGVKSNFGQPLFGNRQNAPVNDFAFSSVKSRGKFLLASCTLNED